MVKHDTGNVTAKIRDPSNMSGQACFGHESRGPQQDITNFNLAQFESIRKIAF